MVEITSFTATSQKTSVKVKIERDCQRLQITRKVKLPAGVGEPEKYQAFHGIYRAFPELVALQIDGRNTEYLELTIGDVNLGMLAAYAQYGEGIISETITTEDGERYCTTIINVLVASIGAATNAEEDFTCEVSKCIVGAEYKIAISEVPVVGDHVLQYKRISTKEGESILPLDVDMLKAILIPANAGIKRMMVRFNNGKTVEWTKADLRELNADENDVETVQVYGGLLEEIGSDLLNVLGDLFTRSSSAVNTDLFVWMLAKVVHIDLHTDGTRFEVTTVRDFPR